MEEVSLISLRSLGKQQQDAWRCCCSLNGVIYFSPSNGNGILTLDIQSRESAIIPTLEICDRRYKWEGCCVVGQKVYFTPCCAPCILILDTSSQTLSQVKTDHICSREWAWALSGSVVGSRIYFAPNQAHCILVFDVGTEEVSSICTEHIYSGDRGYWGCCALGEKVYFAPAGSSSFMVLDTKSHEAYSLGELSSFDPSIDHNGGCRFWGCVAVDGHIYYCPSSAPAIFVLEVGTGTISQIDTEAVSRGRYKWWGVCQVSSDKLYFCPNEASCILILDITTRMLSTITARTVHSDAGRTTAWSWIGCCAVDGEFFAAPGLTETVLTESSHVPNLVLTLTAQVNPGEIKNGKTCEATCRISCRSASGEVITTLDDMPVDASASDLFSAVRIALGLAEWRSPKLCLADGSLLQDNDRDHLTDFLFQ
eukprot:TRINITY_DN81333_c0_g1_i1.p1 TRINITY_DN81333_c0_g1~~TRINITY_DN81333_c0_g1_i1.p1  ORF type:complete len:424 (-),score=42.06 TRINITY_DN81333_c0_g1_i1:117-1388(-)